MGALSEIMVLPGIQKSTDPTVVMFANSSVEKLIPSEEILMVKHNIMSQNLNCRRIPCQRLTCILYSFFVLLFNLAVMRVKPAHKACLALQVSVDLFFLYFIVGVELFSANHFDH